jgi:hypothetical protein
MSMKNGVSVYRSFTMFSSVCSFHDRATASLYGMRSATIDRGPRCRQPADPSRSRTTRARRRGFMDGRPRRSANHRGEPAVGSARAGLMNYSAFAALGLWEK